MQEIVVIVAKKILGKSTHSIVIHHPHQHHQHTIYMGDLQEIMKIPHSENSILAYFELKGG
jgi:hypothetical protein